MAINSIDPQNLIVSAAANALKSHYTMEAESFIYQRIGEDHSERWQLITNGLPESRGTVISLIESNSNVGDEFYCLNNRDIYCSPDSGFS